MSDPTHADAPAADHGDVHEHADEAHEVEALGPVDIASWGAGALGVLIGVTMAVCFAIATGAVAT